MFVSRIHPNLGSRNPNSYLNKTDQNKTVQNKKLTNSLINAGKSELNGDIFSGKNSKNSSFKGSKSKFFGGKDNNQMVSVNTLIQIINKEIKCHKNSDCLPDLKKLQQQLQETQNFPLINEDEKLKRIDQKLLKKYAELFEKDLSSLQQRAELISRVYSNPEKQNIQPNLKFQIDKDPVDQEVRVALAPFATAKKDVNNLHLSEKEVLKHLPFLNQTASQTNNQYIAKIFKNEAAIYEKINNGSLQTIDNYPAIIKNNPELSNIIMNNDALTAKIFKLSKQKKLDSQKMRFADTLAFCASLRNLALLAPGLLAAQKEVTKEVAEIINKIEAQLTMAANGLGVENYANGINNLFQNAQQLIINSTFKNSEYGKIRTSDLPNIIEKGPQNAQHLLEIAQELEKRRSFKNIKIDFDSKKQELTFEQKLKLNFYNTVRDLVKTQQELRQNQKNIQKAEMLDSKKISSELEKPNPDKAKIAFLKKALHLNKKIDQLSNELLLINEFAKAGHDVDKDLDMIGRQDGWKKIKKRIQRATNTPKNYIEGVANFIIPGGTTGSTNFVKYSAKYLMQIGYDYFGGQIVENILRARKRSKVGYSSYDFNEWEKKIGPRPNAPLINNELAENIAEKLLMIKNVNQWCNDTLHNQIPSKDGDKQRELRKNYLKIMNHLLNDEPLNNNGQFSKKLNINLDHVLEKCRQQVKNEDLVKNGNIIKQNPLEALQQISHLRKHMETITHNHNEFFASLREFENKEDTQETVNTKTLSQIQKGQVGYRTPGILGDSFLNRLNDNFQNNMFQKKTNTQSGLLEIHAAPFSRIFVYFNQVFKILEIFGGINQAGLQTINEEVTMRNGKPVE